MRGALCGSERMFEEQVDIHITCFYKNKPVDADNIMAKLYIDGLKGWLIEDDDIHHLHSVTTTADVDAQRPRVEIVIVGRGD